MNPDAGYRATETADVVSAIGIHGLIDRHVTAFLRTDQYRAIEPATTMSITTNPAPGGGVVISIVAYTDEKVRVYHKWETRRAAN